MNDDSLHNLERQISRASAEQQRVFLARLPHMLHLGADDLALLRTAEQSFEFWNNSSDAVYDNL